MLYQKNITEKENESHYSRGRERNSFLSHKVILSERMQRVVDVMKDGKIIEITENDQLVPAERIEW